LRFGWFLGWSDSYTYRPIAAIADGSPIKPHNIALQRRKKECTAVHTFTFAFALALALAFAFD